MKKDGNCGRFSSFDSINPNTPWSRQINAREFKITTILDRLNSLVPYLITFSFQVLSIICGKFGPGSASLVPLCSCSCRALPTTQSPRYLSCFSAEFLPLSS